MSDVHEIALKLAGNVLSVCQELMPQGKVEGHEFVYDPGAGKIKVVLSGQKAGIWSHWGGDGAGDLLDLYIKIRGGALGAALDWARARLGIEKPAFKGSREKQYRRPDRPKQMQTLERTSVVESIDWHLRQERGLMPATLDAFRITEAPFLEGVKEGKAWRWEEPWILYPYLRPGVAGKMELINIKWQSLRRYETKGGKMKPKRIQERDAEPALFGWQAMSPTARNLIVTEGETDCMSGHQLLTLAGRSEAIGVLSVPAGAGRGDKQQWIECEFDNLDRFEDIAICFDEDKEGRNKVALEEIIRRLGVHRCRVMRLPFKDTNEGMVAGMTPEEYFEHWRAAKPLVPDELRNASEFADEVVDEFYPEGTDEPGWTLPWRRMAWLRIRRGEVSLWTGLNGHGKTILLNQVSLHLCDRGERVCIGSFEMPPAKLLERSARQLSHQRKPSEAHIRRLHRWYDDRLWLVDRIGTMDAKRLLEVFTYARRRFACAFFIIDSFLRLGIAEDDYNGQKAVMERLLAFAKDEDCHVALVAHSRKLKDTKQTPGRMDIRGAGALTDLAHATLSVWRDEHKEQKLSVIDDDVTLTAPKREERRADLVNRPDATLTCDKQRHGSGSVGHIQLWFDKDAAAFKERLSGELPRYETVPKDFLVSTDPLS